MSMEDRLQPRRPRMMHIPFLLFLQAVLIVLFGFFVEYDSPAEPEIHAGTTPPKSAVQDGVGNSSDAGRKTTESANGHHRPNDDVNTLGHYYPSKLLFNVRICFVCLVDEAWPGFNDTEIYYASNDLRNAFESFV